VLPTAAVFLGVFSSFSAVVLSAENTNAYSDATEFAAILLPCFAVEVILSGPAAAMMLADESLVRPYRRIKLVTLGLAPAYLVFMGFGLLLVTALMMGVRVASALMLHVAIWQQAGFHVELGWLIRALAAGGTTFLITALTAQLIPGRVVDLVLAPVAGLATFLLLVRIARLLRLDDVEIARRVLPFGHRALGALTQA